MNLLCVVILRSAFGNIEREVDRYACKNEENRKRDIDFGVSIVLLHRNCDQYGRIRYVVSVY